MCAYLLYLALASYIIHAPSCSDNNKADDDRRNYVSKSTAQNNDLVQISGSNFTLRADDQNVPSATARGRDSVRISSQKAYSTHVSMCVSPPFLLSPWRRRHGGLPYIL